MKDDVGWVTQRTCWRWYMYTKLQSVRGQKGTGSESCLLSDTKACVWWISMLLWSGILQTHLGDCEPKDVFSASVCGVFCNFVLDKTCALKGESCNLSKWCEGRISVLACGNVQGSKKMSLFMFGRVEKPWCLLNDHYMCKYKSIAWMTCAVLSEFLLCLDKKMVTKNRKIHFFFVGALYILKVCYIWWTCQHCSTPAASAWSHE